MSKLKYFLKTNLNTIEFNNKVAPSWASKVRRWNQLDGESFCLAEASFYYDSEVLPCSVVLLASEGSLNTDRAFQNSAKVSPSLFVHTLPNVRMLSYSLMSGFEGEMICLNKGKQTLGLALAQNAYMFDGLGLKKILFIQVTKKDEAFYTCDFFELSKTQGRDDYCIEIDKSKPFIEEVCDEDNILREKIERGEDCHLNKSFSMRKSL